MNPVILLECVRSKMPFGKFQGVTIADLPLSYLEWFAAKGFPKGKLGMLMATVYEIKMNGLDKILSTIKQMENAGID